MMRRAQAAATLIAAVALVAAVPAQAPQPPRFRTGVDVVLVEATVLDKSGAVVTGLTPADFTAEVSGKPREIVSAELVEYATPSPDPAEAAGDVEITTNEPWDGGRLVLVLVDQSNMRSEARGVLDAAARWVRSLGPKDRVGLFTFPVTGVRIDFTTDKEKVAEMLGKIIGMSPPPPAYSYYNVSIWEAVRIEAGDTFVRNEVVTRECGRGQPYCPSEIDAHSKSVVFDARSYVFPALEVLRTLIRALSVVPGPKHAVLVSAGWPLDERESATAMSGLAADAARTNVTIHTFTAEQWAMSASRSKPNLRPMQDQMLLLNSVEMLSGMTGGRAVRLAGDANGAFARLNATLGGFYRLGVQALPEDVDGKEHRITLKVSRQGASLASYRRILVPPPAAPPAIADPAEALRAALSGGTPITTIGVRATTYALHAAAGSRDLRIVVAGDIARAAAGTATIVAALYELDGKPVTAKESTIDVPASGSGPVSLTLEAPPGSYGLRLAIRDAEGRMGTLERLVEARWRKVGKVETPGLVIFRARPGMPQPVPVFDGVDTTDEIVVQLALSGPARGTQVEVDVTPLGGTTPVVQQAAPIVQTTSGQTVAHQTLKAAQLPPGRYTLSAKVGGTTFSRTFRVRAPQ